MIFLVALLFTLFFESIVRWFLWNRNHMSCLRQIGYLLSIGIPLLSFGGEGFYLVRFYTVYFLMCLLQDTLLIVPRGYINHSTRIRFVFFGSLHMTIMGLWILITPYNIWDVMQEKELVALTASISLLILGFTKFMSIFTKARTDFTIYQQREHEFSNLFRFLNANIVYLFFESILSEYSMQLEMDFAYLMCTNCISIVYICYYIVSLSEILKNLDTEVTYGHLKITLGESDQKLEVLRNSAYYDSLTGAYSRVYILAEMEKYLKDQTVFSVVYLDLNRLKEINDQEGHQAGDIYLQVFVQEMKKRVRSKDVVARYGGDEFLLLFPNCLSRQAKDRVEKIRCDIMRDKKQYTFGAGIADTTEEHSIEGLIALADQRMYGDKKREELKRT